MRSRPPSSKRSCRRRVRDLVLKPFTGDLDAMVKRRLVRVGVTFNRTFYFVDKGVQRGMAYEYGQLIEERLNKHFKTGTRQEDLRGLRAAAARQLLPALVDGKVDLVAAQVTVRPELQKFVDFTNPTRTNVSEIVVTGPGAAAHRLGRRTCPARRCSSARRAGTSRACSRSTRSSRPRASRRW